MTSKAEELKWWAEVAPAQNWHWSTTMATDFPHIYVVRGSKISDEVYDRLFDLTFACGVPAKFYQRVNIELVLPDLEMEFGSRTERSMVKGFKFWPMSHARDGSTVINAAPAHFFYGEQDAPSTVSPYETVYDFIAGDYDERYKTPEGRSENAAVWREVMGDRYVKSLLDLGGRTGLSLDMRMSRQDADHYRVVEPSQGLLNRLLMKHPWVTDIIPSTVEDYFDDPRLDANRHFDTVIALFGAASYIPPDLLKPLVERADRRVVLMHYREGYRPDFYGPGTLPEYADLSREAAVRLPGASVQTLNNFQMVTVAK